MLGRAREADDPPDEGVVSAVGAAGVEREHLIQAVRGIVSGSGRHVDPDRAKPWGGHRDEQRGLCLAAGGKIVESRADELVPG